MRSSVMFAGIVSVLAIAEIGCSRQPVVAPEPPQVQEVELHYSARFANSDGAFTIKGVEFADEAGIVRQVRDPLPLWEHTLKLKRGDRIYVRADVTYEGAFWTAVQVRSPSGLSYVASIERVDGPNSGRVEIDEIVP